MSQPCCGAIHETCHLFIYAAPGAPRRNWNEKSKSSRNVTRAKRCGNAVSTRSNPTAPLSVFLQILKVWKKCDPFPAWKNLELIFWAVCTEKEIIFQTWSFDMFSDNIFIFMFLIRLVIWLHWNKKHKTWALIGLSFLSHPPWNELYQITSEVELLFWLYLFSVR